MKHASADSSIGGDWEVTTTAVGEEAFPAAPDDASVFGCGVLDPEERLGLPGPFLPALPLFDLSPLAAPFALFASFEPASDKVASLPPPPRRDVASLLLPLGFPLPLPRSLAAREAGAGAEAGAEAEAGAGESEEWDVARASPSAVVKVARKSARRRGGMRWSGCVRAWSASWPWMWMRMC